MHSVVKKPNHITSAHKSTLNIQLDKNKKQPPQLPLIEINLSNFKSNLLGLSKPEIIELLDKPNFKRTEHPASIWQYQSPVCFVDIFFYYIKQVMIVDHVETRSIGLKRVNEKICFSSLIDSRYATRGQNQDVQ